MNAPSRADAGFTLIELLVVIAIIGILSSVVLASLNTARSKGADAAIKSQMEQMRVQAELYYSNHNGYSTVSSFGDDDKTGCTTDANASQTVFNTTDGIGNLTLSALGNLSSGARPLCRASTASWALAMPLHNPTGSNTGWCVDSSGASKEVNVVFDVGKSGLLLNGSTARCP